MWPRLSRLPLTDSRRENGAQPAVDTPVRAENFTQTGRMDKRMKYNGKQVVRINSFRGVFTAEKRIFSILASISSVS